MKNKPLVSIVTLGCKVNTYESEAVASLLEKNGYTVLSGLVFADIYIINTCAVTNEAERKSRGQIAKVLTLNPDAEIYVCGCSAQNDPTKFVNKNNVVYVMGTSNKVKIANLIMQKEKANEQGYENQIATQYEDIYDTKHTRARATIKIQDGCNNFCTYCLIPYLRGRERSRSLESIKAEIDRLEKTTAEIVLTGINMSSYGSDFKEKKLGLIDVCELFKGRSVKFRISSLEVNVITKAFLERLKRLDSFQPHFHLSMQSGCDNVLTKMNRKYTASEYLSKVALIRKYFPDAGITTDVIVAFPTETNSDFEETFETCKNAKFLWMHVFPYSKRDGTVAAKFKNINDGNVSKERVKMLTELAKISREEFICERIGREYEAIVEQEKDGIYIAHTPNFIKCYFESNERLSANDKVLLKIQKTQNDGAKCVKIG